MRLMMTMATCAKRTIQPIFIIRHYYLWPPTRYQVDNLFFVLVKVTFGATNGDNDDDDPFIRHANTRRIGKLTIDNLMISTFFVCIAPMSRFSSTDLKFES
jgi:hypothetical protein